MAAIRKAIKAETSVQCSVSASPQRLVDWLLVVAYEVKEDRVGYASVSVSQGTQHYIRILALKICGIQFRLV